MDYGARATVTLAPNPCHFCPTTLYVCVLLHHAFARCWFDVANETPLENVQFHTKTFPPKIMCIIILNKQHRYVTLAPPGGVRVTFETTQYFAM